MLLVELPPAIRMGLLGILPRTVLVGTIVKHTVDRDLQHPGRGSTRASATDAKAKLNFEISNLLATAMAEQKLIGLILSQHDTCEL